MIIHQVGVLIISELWKPSKQGSTGSSSIIVIQKFVSGVMVVQSLLFLSGPFVITDCNLFEIHSLSMKSIGTASDVLRGKSCQDLAKYGDG